jgi:hypothetical protein
MEKYSSIQSDLNQHTKLLSYYMEIFQKSEYYDRYGGGPSAARQERLRRRLVPVFKNMLK